MQIFGVFSSMYVPQLVKGIELTIQTDLLIKLIVTRVNKRINNSQGAWSRGSRVSQETLQNPASLT